MTPKVLVWKGKHETVYIDASDAAAAFMGLFWRLKKAGFYHDLEPAQQVLYDYAIDGNTHCAEKLLKRRRDYQYEEWDLVTPERPANV